MERHLFSVLILAMAVLLWPYRVGASPAPGGDKVTYESVDMVAGIEFRWLNNAGFEMILPNGNHVLIDPWLDSADMFPLSVTKDIERADYIVLSHIHSDHAEDVKIIQDKFPNVRIIIGALSAEPLARWQKLNINKFYLAHSGEKFEFNDVTIEVFASRHTEGARGNYLRYDKDGFLDPQSFGAMEMLNFLITASDGTKVMVWGGMTSEDQINRLRGTNPDIAVMHVSPKQDFSLFGKLVASMNAKVVIPHHYDIWESLFKNNPNLMKDSPLPPEQVTVENILALFKKSLASESPGTYFFVPEHHKWYHFGFGFAESKVE
jgi:L-ascorbate metabolism protein UlaG (beta-lactamase superfamily)